MSETVAGATHTLGTRPQPHLFLVRHGRTTLNAEGKLRGFLDPPLDEIGTVEALELASTLAYIRPVRIVASPLIRARQTADAIGRHVGLDPVVDRRLIDRDYGRWAGHRQAEVIARWGSLDAAPGVEPASDVAERARAVIDEQIGWLHLGPVVVVAHDAVNRLLLSSLEDTLGAADSIPQRTACWNMLLRTDDGWQVELVDQPSTQKSTGLGRQRS